MAHVRHMNISCFMLIASIATASAFASEQPKTDNKHWEDTRKVEVEAPDNPRQLSEETAFYDRKLFDQATVVMRAEVLDDGEGSKYVWPEIRVIKVFKRSKAVQFDKKMKIAHYGWTDLPLGICTLYLVRYNPGHPEYGWKLLESEGNKSKTPSGYSHHEE